jgi:hypothetical protein
MKLEVPQEWVGILKAVQRVYPDALMAGGALRDLDNGKEVKDIDIFFHGDPDEETQRALHLGLMLYRPGLTSSCDLSYVGANDATRSMVFQGLVGDPPVNLVALKEPAEKALDRMDFGLCQIGFDGYCVFKTPAYQLDKRNMTFTLTRADDKQGVQRSLKRFERLTRDKYQGWQLSVPEKFWEVYEVAAEANRAARESMDEIDQILEDTA